MVKPSERIFWLKIIAYWENIIWNKVRSDIEKELDSESVNNKKFLKTKIKSYSEKVTDFYSKKFLRWLPCPQKKWKLLSASVFKDCKYICKSG